MKSNIVKILNILIVCNILIFGRCSNAIDTKEEKPPVEKILETDIEIGYLQTNKGDYNFGNQVELTSFSVKNTSKTKISIANISARIKSFDKNQALKKTTKLIENIEIGIGKESKIEKKLIFKIPNNLVKDSYGVYIYVVFSDGTIREFYKTFFRVFDRNTQMVYKIDREDYNGLPIFKLKNGLSAEYAIQKSAASFLSGISHTWNLPLHPIASTPDFLERSINKTIAFYNSTIGSSTNVKTVIISTGIPGVPYVARAMNALVLPLHYLVGAGTVKEAQTMLEHANSNGYSVYGTLGYDYSVSTRIGVAWIKLLDLPKQYKKFIADHQVKNVILYGHALGGSDGERGARKVADTRGKYEKGSLYLMHFSGSSSEGFLRKILSDFEQTKLANKIRIADWESGIIPQQINGFTTSLKKTSVSDIKSITATSGGTLWDMGTYASLALIHKNKTLFEVGGLAIRGISLNPYLISHPTFESWLRYVPFSYWQVTPVKDQYDNMNTTIRAAIKSYFPNIVFSKLKFRMNFTGTHANNMSNYLKNKGLKVVTYDDNVGGGDYWDISNGINAPSEIRAKQITDVIGSTQYKNWNKSLQYLTPNDLKNIEVKFPKVIVKDY